MGADIYAHTAIRFFKRLSGSTTSHFFVSFFSDSVPTWIKLACVADEFGEHLSTRLTNCFTGFAFIVRVNIYANVNLNGDSHLGHQIALFLVKFTTYDFD